MSVVLPYKAIERVASSIDPKEAILKEVGDLSGLNIMGDMVLIGTYVRPEKTAGGIIRPGINISEDIWQGKAGLVLKCGPQAFVDTADFSFNGEKANIGDWCVFKVGDAWQLQIREWPCRLVRDVNIRMKVNDPTIIF